jgi:hypothetical protein
MCFLNMDFPFCHGLPMQHRYPPNRTKPDESSGLVRDRAPVPNGAHDV